MGPAFQTGRLVRAAFDTAQLGFERKRLLARARRKSPELTVVSDKTAQIKQTDLLLFFCAKDEVIRLPFFLDYYRGLGVAHFIAVDNGSGDGSVSYLKDQPDCSIWLAKGSYKDARFGMDWLTHLQSCFAPGHWCLTVDPDEFFVFPHMDQRPLQALLDWLDSGHIRSFGAILLDMYSKKSVEDAQYRSGNDPLKTAPFFDPLNYQSLTEPFYLNAFIQGGPRQRVYFPDRPGFAPALNKIPLVKWSNGMVYRSSMHQLLPRSLNITYSYGAIPKPCGVLLHFKFLDTLVEKTKTELVQKQHYASSREYKAYAAALSKTLWTPHSKKYKDWKQLEKLGLMSRGDWV
ncbi:MAG: glycosyltransferase family 2 protein [Pseudomonadota bacterium]